ncbi:MAG: ABC transporter substrate-binding protein [Acidimicrobiales bacterium]|nr:ABC transporter substrate-binding protein [Acidimicrobiales bacterium]
MTAAVDADVDAVIVNAADSACVPIMKLAKQLELRAQVYLVGACAGEEILDAAGADAEGIIYSGEGPADPDDLEGMIYDEVVARYATGPAQAAGTVGFRGFMNLYGAFVEIGYDNLTSENILNHMRSAVDVPSFWGHPYTCDGQRIPGLPALCAPEQTLFTTTGVPGEDIVFLPEDFADTGGWIETDDLYAAAFG